jgi:hypothetical protein
MKLTEFLLARIAEDEAAAIAARGWQTGSRHKGQPLDWSIHMDRWSPDRVLAECEAKRRIIEAHPLTHDVVAVHSGETPGVACANCAALGRSEKDIVEDLGPCDTLLALASIYSDHPDFDEAWRL